MKPEARLELIHGPYSSPAVQIGDDLECEIRGWLKVCRFSTGRIPWPMGHPGGQTGGRHSVIVCHDLAQAVRSESGMAVQQWWGISEAVVTRWRAALGVELNNEGTRHLRALQSTGELSPERIARLRQQHLHRDRAQAHHRPELAWPAAEAALLGTMPDTEVAKRVGCSVSVVRTCRMAQGILPYHPNRPPSLPRLPGKVALSPENLKAKRIGLGLVRAQVAQQAGISRECYGYYERYLGRQVDPDIKAGMKQSDTGRIAACRRHLVLGLDLLPDLPAMHRDPGAVGVPAALAGHTLGNSDRRSRRGAVCQPGEPDAIKRVTCPSGVDACCRGLVLLDTRPDQGPEWGSGRRSRV